LHPEDKAWLERQAEQGGQSMAELVREAVRRMRRQQEASFEELLEQTRGIWRRGDGLSYQRRVAANGNDAQAAVAAARLLVGSRRSPSTGRSPTGRPGCDGSSAGSCRMRFRRLWRSITG